MSDEERAREVARGLTQSQAFAFLSGVYDLIGDCSVPAMRRLGLLGDGFYGPEPTPFGRLVAQHLREASHER